jgi:hypothetical protein
MVSTVTKWENECRALENSLDEAGNMTLDKAQRLCGQYLHRLHPDHPKFGGFKLVDYNTMHCRMTLDRDQLHSLYTLMARYKFTEARASSQAADRLRIFRRIGVDCTKITRPWQVIIWHVVKESVSKAKKDMLQAGAIALVARDVHDYDKGRRVASGKLVDCMRAWWVGEPYGWEEYGLYIPKVIDILGGLITPMGRLATKD